MCNLNNGVASPKTAECTCSTDEIVFGVDCYGNEVSETIELACDNCKNAMIGDLIGKGISPTEAYEYASYHDTGFRYLSTDEVNVVSEYNSRRCYANPDDLPF